MEISHKNWQDFRSRPAKHGPWGTELEISQVLLIASQEIPAAWGIFTRDIVFEFSQKEAIKVSFKKNIKEYTVPGDSK